MLGKLLKHEYRATARMMAPTYGILILLTAVERAFLAILQSRGLLTFGQAPQQAAAGAGDKMLSLFGAFTLLIYFAVLAAAAFLTVFFLVQRFYKNLLTDEGYLSFTLPVTPAAQVGAKLISAVSWIILSIALIALSLLTMFYQPGLAGRMFDAICQSFMTSMDATRGDCFLVLAIFGVDVLLSILTQMLLFYVSAAVGHLISAQHKLLASFAAYLVIMTALQTALLLCILPFSIGVEALNGWAMSVQMFYLIMGMGCLLYVVLDAALFYVTARIFKNRLNLE